MSRRPHRSPARRGRFRLIFALQAWRAAAPLCGPLATMVSNAGRSNPARRIRLSMASAMSRSVRPARDLFEHAAGHLRQQRRRIPQRGNFVVVLAHANALDQLVGRDECRPRAGIAGEGRREQRMAADREIRRFEAQPGRRQASQSRQSASRRTSRRPPTARDPGTPEATAAASSSAVTYRKSVMKLTLSGVRTTTAALPVKFVRYRMLDRVVTTSASS